MKSKILFLAPFPTSENIKDGMISRIKDIDRLFEDVDRTYLDLSLRRNLKTIKKIDSVNVIELNAILNFWYIIKLVKEHNYFYTHSIFNMRFFWVFLLFFDKKKKLILDAHGVVTEEMKYFDKKKYLSMYFSFIERFVFRRLSFGIFVTTTMSDYFKKKYPKSNFRSLIYHIIPRDLKEFDVNSKEIQNKTNDRINILYSGGVHSWQNIELMMDTISLNQIENLHYTILTNDVKYIKEEISKRGINPNVISVDSREPSELWKDYLKADYGFVLRDDNIVNNVACPTKLIEYLFYGINPIVLTPNIGDFKSLGYEYCELDDFNKGNYQKAQGFNLKNFEIVKFMIKNNLDVDIKRIVFDEVAGMY